MSVEASHMIDEDSQLASLKAVCRLKGYAVAETLLQQFLLHPESAYRDQRIRISQRTIKLEKINTIHLPIVLKLKNNSACVLTAINSDNSVHIIAPDIEQDSIKISYNDLQQEYAGDAISVEAVTKTQRTNINLQHLIVSFRKPLLTVAALSFFIATLTFAIPGFTYLAISKLQASATQVALWLPALLTAIAICLMGVFHIYRLRCADKLEKNYTLFLRQKISHIISSINLSRYQKHSQQLATLYYQFNQANTWLSLVSIKCVSLIFSVVSLCFVAVLVGWLSMIPIVAVLATLALSLSIARRRAQHMPLSEAQVLPTAAAYKTVGAENLLMKEIENLPSQPIKYKNWHGLLPNLICIFMFLGLTVVGIENHVQGGFSIMALATALVLSLMALMPYQRFYHVLEQTFNLKSGLNTLNFLQQEWLETMQPMTRETFKGSIELKGIDFNYLTQTQTFIHDLSLSIKPGERVGIIGSIGSGKSTLLKLMAGLLLADSGCVMLDGNAIDHCDTHLLTTAVSYVPQKPTILAGTLRDNIVAKAPWLSDDEIILTLRRLGADEIFLRMPVGLNTHVSSSGEPLSIGQQQLISLARAAVTTPSVLLFDEPTATLDNNSEKHFLRFVENYNPAASMVIVTHKMAMLRLVDRVIVLQDGKILADGDKEQVLSVIKQVKSATKWQ